MADPVLEEDERVNDGDIVDFPTLHSVVESGDETIIQTSRIGHDMVRELSAISAYSEPHIHVGQDEAVLQNRTLAALEEKLENVIEQHVSALRRDIRRVLNEALVEHEETP